jgi:hypothetical protein
MCFQRILAGALTLWILQAGPAVAQDQTVVIAKPPVVCAPVGNAGLATLAFVDAPKFITTALGTTPAGGVSYALHVVRYIDNETSVDQSHWYAYSSEWAGRGWWYWLVDPRNGSHFTETRFFGDRHAALAYMHHNIPAIARALALQTTFKDQLSLRAAAPNPADRATLASEISTLYTALLTDYTKWSLKATPAGSLPVINFATDFPGLAARVAAVPADLQGTRAIHDEMRAAADASRAVYGTLFGQGQAASTIQLQQKGTNRPLARLDDNYLTTQNAADLLSLVYRVEITKKKPAPLQNLVDAAGIALGTAARDAQLLDLVDRLSLCGGRQFEVYPLPSDMVFTAKFTSEEKEKQLAKLTFDNEKKYRYDFSFALPLKSYNDLTYSVENGSITAKKVTKADLFAAVNLSIFPVDTKRWQSQLFPPSLIYGMPITGKPLKHHLIGLGFGLNRVQMWGGFVINEKEEAPNPDDPDATPERTWESSPSFGINFSIASIKQLLTKK